MPSSFLLAGMQRSWQEAKQPSWRVRKPHTKDEGKEPECPNHVAKSPSPTWPTYLDSFLERKLRSCNKPKENILCFLSELNQGQNDTLILSPLTEMRKAYPDTASVSQGSNTTLIPYLWVPTLTQTPLRSTQDL